jgi:hypothetical protein
MEATAGTLNVGSPWIVRDKNLQENFRVFSQSRLGKPKKENEGRTVSSMRTQQFSQFLEGNSTPGNA